MNPPITDNLLGMEQSLRNHLVFNTIFRGTAQSEDGGEALIFIHEAMLEPLRNVRQLFQDGTFRVSIKKCTKI